MGYLRWDKISSLLQYSLTLTLIHHPHLKGTVLPVLAVKAVTRCKLRGAEPFSIYVISCDTGLHFFNPVSSKNQTSFTFFVWGDGTNLNATHQRTWTHKMKTICMTQYHKVREKLIWG